MPGDEIVEYLNGIDEDDTNNGLTSISTFNKMITNSGLRDWFRFSSILCLSNIPPPIRTNIRTSIYFHNRLLIKPLSHKINLKSKLFNLLKSFYIKRFNQKNYKWIVQTPLMKKLLQDDLKIDSDNCHVYPFYKIGSNKSFI